MFGTGRRRNSRQPAEVVAGLLRSREVATERAGRIALAAMLSARHLDHPVDLQRVLEMALAQALASEEARERLDHDDGLHLHALLLELENAGTSEARLVQSLGELLDGRAPRVPDRFLRDLGHALREEATTAG